MFRPYKISCFPSQHASLLESASGKILFFISLNLKYLALQLFVFRWKQIYFVLYFNKNMFLSDFTICFYDRNTFHMIYGKNKIILVSKISIWPCRKDKNKKRTRASLFQSSEDGKQEFFLCGLTDIWRFLSGLICNYMYLHKFNRATLYPGVLYVVLY